MRDTLFNKKEKHDTLIEWLSTPIKPFDIGWEGCNFLKPGRVVGIGGNPSSGKSMLVCQWTFEALRKNLDLKALMVCTGDLSRKDIYARELGRQLKRSPNWITEGSFAENNDDKNLVIDHWRDDFQFLDRLRFLETPFTDEDLREKISEADDYQWIVIDYLQAISTGESRDRNTMVEKVLASLMRLKDDKKLFILVSSLNRANYGVDDMSAFKNCGDIEFWLDDGFILSGKDDLRKLAHVKSRHGVASDLNLRFKDLNFSIRGV